MRRILIALCSLIALAATLSIQARYRSPATLDRAARAEVIEALVRELTRDYVFADKAAAMEKELREQAARHAYDTLTEPADFARMLTTHLQGITHDKHLRVGLDNGGRPGAPPPTFGATKRLDGNIAYVEITSFAASPDSARESVRTVMSAAADARALILDLRANGGGQPQMVALVSSYLFGDRAVHLNSLYWRARDRTDRFFTDPGVGGAKFGPDKPVYVVTSARTFSAAEEFTYNLQSLKRATIVGETTGGGAHPGGAASLPHGLRAFIPSGRAINPITGTNWEGTGVKPDVPVAAAVAVDTAHTLARERVGTRD